MKKAVEGLYVERILSQKQGVTERKNVEAFELGYRIMLKISRIYIASN